MAKQPVNPNTNIETQFSLELSDTIHNINEFYLLTYPSRQISVTLFLVAAIENDKTMAYKCLNSILSTNEITAIREGLISELTSAISGDKPTKNATVSIELMKHIKGARNLMEEYNSKTITTDLVLYSIVKSDENIKNKFKNVSLIALENAMKTLHEVSITFQDFFADFPIQINDDNMPQSLAFITDTNDSKSQYKTSKSVLDTHCTNLNELAKSGKIDDLIGRDDEISILTNVLNRRKCNNAVLVGDSGVGKTHIVEGLAKRIIDGIAPTALKNKVIFKANLMSLASSTQYRGMFEARIASLVKDLENNPNAILFIDDMHNMLNDKSKNDYDIASLLNNAFVNGNIQIIASTTPMGYKNCFKRDASLSRKFQRIDVQSPSVDECIDIINKIIPAYEKFHGVKFEQSAINACVTLSKRYITDINLPSSAIDIIDEAGAFKKINKLDSDELSLSKNTLHELLQSKDEISKTNDIEKLKNIDELINATRLNISNLRNQLESNKKLPVVSENDIYNIISKHTNIPISKINSSEKKILANISNVLKKHIIGQDDAIDKITQAIKRNKVGIYDKNKPTGSFLCIGNSGVGKTLLAKKLAEEIYGDEKYLVRFDMSEYADKTSVNKLIGAASGYVGYDKGGLLTEAIKNKKHCVLLIDEIEKANELVFNIFLQILDEGFLTDNEGCKVDFKNTLIIMTSNVGTKRASSEKSVGFIHNDDINEKHIIEKELKNKFPPEFLNRLTDIIYFNKLSDDNLKQIIKIELDNLIYRTNLANYNFNYDENIIPFLFNKLDKNGSYGARPISRLIQSLVENKLCDIIINSNDDSNSFSASVINDDIEILKN